MFIHRKRRSLSLSTDAFFSIQKKNNKNYQGYKHLEVNEDTKGPYLISTRHYLSPVKGGGGIGGLWGGIWTVCVRVCRGGRRWESHVTNRV